MSGRDIDAQVSSLLRQFMTCNPCLGAAGQPRCLQSYNPRSQRTYNLSLLPGLACRPCFHFCFICINLFLYCSGQPAGVHVPSVSPVSARRLLLRYPSHKCARERALLEHVPQDDVVPGALSKLSPAKLSLLASNMHNLV